ncbi:MAG: hypothetical protein A2157_19670 [Deltaproteobacteria bacterium RBG_16_47_11]|nr:MAG: hypothetical protein A2157_19670 [Deltaproteobacteria bacterium RBG_16_47_11]
MEDYLHDASFPAYNGLVFYHIIDILYTQMFFQWHVYRKAQGRGEKRKRGRGKRIKEKKKGNGHSPFLITFQQ